MKKYILILFVFSLGISSSICQNEITNSSSVIGNWRLVSPDNSPGPEFIPESYKGISRFTIKSSEQLSIAIGTISSSNDTSYSFTFIPQFDGKKLTGKVQSASWIKDASGFRVSIPFQYVKNKDQIVIHLNNPEYGNVKFIYERVR